MLARFSRLMVVVALVFAVGAHWAILQSVAWVSMAVTYSQDAPLGEALAKTFDGKHPCSLCKFVADGKQSEKQREAQKPVPKLDLLAAVPRVFLMHPPVPAPADLLAFDYSPPVDSPFLPPPRMA
ncbi:MAG: hypothetical protein AB1705_03455 [Verrucomicrobiota bacterium]